MSAAARDLPPLEARANARLAAVRLEVPRRLRTVYLLPDVVQVHDATRGPSVDVSWADVEALARAFLPWSLLRTAWAAYFEKGLPPSSTAAQVHQPPGEDAAPTTVGFVTGRTVHAGRRLQGAVTVRALATDVARGDGIVAVADLWRVEPGVGPEGGEKVGERWVLDDRVVLDVLRPSAVSLHGDVEVPWAVAELDEPRRWLAQRPHPR